MLPQIVCPLALLLVSLPSIVALSWTYKFRSYEPKACFYVNIPDVTQKLSFYFNLHDNKASDLGHDMDYVVSGPTGQVLHTQQQVSHADATITPVSIGEHSICFTHHGTPTEKIIDLDTSLTKPEAAPGQTGATELKTESPTAELERISSRVKVDLTELYETLRSLKSREKSNYYTVTSVKALIKWFSIFQCVTVILLGVAHVYILKTFFSTSAKTRV